MNIKGFNKFFRHAIYAYFYKNLFVKKSLEWLHWWLEASLKPQSHIFDIFNLFCMRYVDSPKAHVLTFLKQKFTM